MADGKNTHLTMEPYKKIFLVILDGFGLAGREEGNAILKAKTPFLDSALKTYPAMPLEAAGLIVGLPWGQPGNSEVGHSAIGTGRVVIQDLARINGEIRSGDFFKNPALLEAVAHAKKHNSALHLMGCTSPGGIHSHVDHLVALLGLARREGLKKVFVHVITDGQDMPLQDGSNVLHMLQKPLADAGARIASMQGRSYAMDRVLNWKLTEKVWHAVALGDAPVTRDPLSYLEKAYQRDQNDYSLEPVTVVDETDEPVGALHDNDAFIFFDFRNDRVRQLATPFIAMADFDSFDLVRKPKNVKVVTMTKYNDEFTAPVAYEHPTLPATLGEIISMKGWKQWRIAEKEKEAHVSNFFNGGRIEPFKNEQHDIVSSRMMKGKEYVTHPEMSAEKIVDAVLAKIDDDSRLSVINFANPDMIAHSGDLPASIRAIEITDRCLQDLFDVISQKEDAALVITADHGNAEELLDPKTGGEDTQHSTRTVPAVFIAPALKGKGNSDMTLEKLAQEGAMGTLVDVAPTVLSLLSIEKPKEMTGSSLL